MLKENEGMIMEKKIYLDNAATTRVDDEVVKAMLPFFNEEYGNPSSLHEMGIKAQRAVENARKTIARAIGASQEEIIFTSGATESDNLAVKGYVRKHKTDKKNKIITTKIEHDAVLKTCNQLAREGFEIVYLNVDKEGFIDFEQLEKELDDQALLVSVIHGNNEIGAIQDIKRIGKLCKKHNVVFHTDATQSFCKIPLDVNDIHIDMLTMNGHKLHGPKGIGALYIKSGIKIDPLYGGGAHEFRLRPGTHNVPGIVGFAKAVEIQQKDIQKNAKQVKELRDYMVKRLCDEIEECYLNGPQDLSLDKRLPNNINLRFSYIEGESLLFRLSDFGIMASTGSACSSASLKPSHVLLALGLPHEKAHGSLRLTLSKYTTKEEVDYAVEKIKKVVEELREISPLTKR
jgi:cysteine desulfurase